jgi:hypothetical protein
MNRLDLETLRFAKADGRPKQSGRPAAARSFAQLPNPDPLRFSACDSGGIIRRWAQKARPSSGQLPFWITNIYLG